MKKEKQNKLAKILATGLYEVDVINGLVYANRKRGKVLLKTHKLPTGYEQITLFAGRGTGIKIVVYIHQVVYFAKYGSYEETYHIDHINGCKQHNGYLNLRCVTVRENTLNRQQERVYGYNNVRLIRSKEIEAIKGLMLLDYSQAKIAKELNLNRLSVRNIYNKIKQGVKLKYE